MQRYVERATEVPYQRKYVQHRRHHRPESGCREREYQSRRGTEQVDREMPGVEVAIGRRDRKVQDLVGTHHRNCYRYHRAFWPAAAPHGVAKSQGEKNKEGSDPHSRSFSRPWLPVKLHSGNGVDVRYLLDSSFRTLLVKIVPGRFAAQLY